MFRLKLHLHGAEIKDLQLESGREYTFGRAPSCDVQLEEQPGISRNHFRLFEENGRWTAQVTSKFGDLLMGGRKVQSITLEPGTIFKLGGYDFHFLEPVEQQQLVPVSQNLPMAAGQSEVPSRSSRSSLPAPVSNNPSAPVADFNGNSEATQVMMAGVELPYLRVVDRKGVEESIKLEGKKWIAGREDGSDILLNDKKASRRQFELTSTPQGYFIRDLGSANGTSLNGFPLAPDELKAIRSGDVIVVGRVTLHFEIRDPNFEKKLAVIPPQARTELPMVVPNQYEMINFPVPQGPGGAVVLADPAVKGVFGTKLGAELPEPKKKKLQFWIIAGVLLTVVVGFLSFEGEKPKPKGGPMATNEAFYRLSPKQQQTVKENYVLAKNLMTQNRYALAADALIKIHELLPDGYEGSKSMAEECGAAKHQADMLGQIEADKKRAEENRRIVERTVRECNRRYGHTMLLRELNECLGPAVERDPENAEMRSLITKIEQRIEQKSISERNQREFASRVAAGRELHQKALRLEQKGEWHDAIEAYKRHMKAGLPDPGGLVGVSRNNMMTLTKNLDAKIEEYLKGAEAAAAAGNYPSAFEQIKKAKAIDSQSERAAEMNAKYRRELNVKLKELYETSVISEGIGLVDEAKTRWKQIMDMDSPDGDYYKKARSKLKSYGAL